MATRVVTVTSLADVQANDRIIRSISHADGRIEATVERSVPEVEPGTVGTATVRGIEGVRVVRTSRTVANNRDVAWFTPIEEQIGGWWHREDEVTSFVPDPDTAALRAEVDRLGVERDGYRNDAMTHLEDARRLSARADAAEARLARACAAIAAQITSWEAENSERWAEIHTSVKVAIDAAQYAVVENLRDLLALVAADEQAAEGEAPAALATRDEIAQALHRAWWAAMEIDRPYVWTDMDPVTRRGFLAEADAAIALLTGGQS